MSQELKQQATRLGLIFARYGIELSRAEKLSLIAEIQGHKGWATTAGISKEKPASKSTESTVRTPFSPLQLLAAKQYGLGDYSRYRFEEDVVPEEDSLFEYVLLEARLAGDDIDDFLSSMRTAVHDIEAVIDTVTDAVPGLDSSAPFAQDGYGGHGEEPLTSTAVRFADGSTGIRAMSHIVDAGGDVYGRAAQLWPSIVGRLTSNVALRERLRGAAGATGASVVVYAGEAGLLLEHPVCEAVAVSKEAYEARLQKVLEALRSFEESGPGIRAGLARELQGNPEKHGWYDVAWVFIPDGALMERSRVQSCFETLTAL
ncbi:hypothetical protein F6X40_35715 [Paraburkholderia sp. UCT31]|uniref:hypothetical protein n=1 Tax=Paraburkholderia sp. UCT31 TaxID=2615209 RepID=UPI001655A3DC|nr:hypothetical protein [Paraburkholderia sp. UCT31]MBC8741899.1 hypothetical protein [Paraburkholderia sp. UCT31]